MRSTPLSPLAVIITFLVGVLSVVLAGSLFQHTYVETIDGITIVDDATEFGCNRQDPESEARAIYSAIINNGSYDQDPLIVIDEISDVIRGTPGNLDPAETSGVSAETIENYRVNNDKSSSIRSFVAGLPRVRVMSPKDHKYLFRNTVLDHAGFHKKYPGSRGILSFSNIGYNDAHTQAIAYFSFNGGGQNGHGAFLMLLKVKGNWTVADTFGLWRS